MPWKESVQTKDAPCINLTKSSGPASFCAPDIFRSSSNTGITLMLRCNLSATSLTTFQYFLFSRRKYTSRYFPSSFPDIQRSQSALSKSNVGSRTTFASLPLRSFYYSCAGIFSNAEIFKSAGEFRYLFIKSGLLNMRHSHARRMGNHLRRISDKVQKVMRIKIQR